MQNTYQMRSPIAQRGPQAFGLASQAALIDPHLSNHHFSISQMSQAFAQVQSRANSGMAVTHGQDTNDSPVERALPSTDVTNETLDDAYVQFILYCNPSLPDGLDTTDLRKGFRAPPKSDGKSFDTYVLFGLISKLEAKDIKTWTDLVVELGVELPDASKNQSTQKVQQYAVRLKVYARFPMMRWLRAFHVDAFFHYCLNIPNTYYGDVPGKGACLEGAVRDGVPTEEDLALRALLPEWRPKRGRRKADEADVDTNNSTNKRVQHQRANSADFLNEFNEQFAHPTPPQSGAPWSAHPQSQHQDLWAAAQVAIAPRTPSTGRTPASSQLSADSAGQLLQWRSNDTQTPASPYPHSALTTRATFPITPSVEDPKSAGPLSGKSPSRSRKRHGPAVSSAWQSGSNPNSGKLRGRPPGNRTVQDGPFSTFPANPGMKEASTGDLSTSTQSANPNTSESQVSSDNALLDLTSHTSASDQLQAAAAAAARKPSRLQLQVPEHAGGPVRLATPPTVLINGESGRQSTSSHERASSADFFGQFDSASDGDARDDVVAEEHDSNIDWKRRCMVLKRKLQEKENELKTIKRRVLDAVL